MFIDHEGREFHSCEEAEDYHEEQEFRARETERREAQERRDRQFHDHQMLLDQQAWKTGNYTPEPSGPSFNPRAILFGLAALLVLYLILHFM